MEFFRRFGISERVRNAGFPREIPMDVFVVTTLQDPPILQLEYPSVAKYEEHIRATNDGSVPREPYQLISQYTLEPVLKSVADEMPTVDVRFGHELVSFEQDADGVTAIVRASDGSEEMVRASYLVGCDGGTRRRAQSAGYQVHRPWRHSRDAAHADPFERSFRAHQIGQGTALPRRR